MADIVSAQVRSRMMAGIRSKDTNPEMILRRGLHRRGFRFRLHDKQLQGRPDLIFPKFRAVIFAHGCFWHGHACRLFKWPSTRPEFWRAKIESNIERDRASQDQLKADSWRIGIVWECAMKGSNQLNIEAVLDTCGEWLFSTSQRLEISSSEARSPL